MLSIASIPNEVLIFHDKFSSISVTKWLLSMVPLLQARKGATNYHSQKLGADLWNLDGTNAENIAMLYPLHQFLLDSLRYLTTTSLLPAELQLVSISMINLLFFSSSPQALILEILLWVGGMAIFILCAGVLQWAVALARVPSWRFRRPQRRSREGFVFVAALDDCLKGRLNKWGIFSSIYEYSEAEDEPSKSESSNRKGPPMLKLKTSINEQHGLTLPASAIDGNIQPQHAKGLGSVNSLVKEKNRPRRHTVLSYIGPPPRGLSQKKPKSTHSSRFSLIKPRSFLSLTRSQAVVVKWSFAAYVYAIVAGIIGIPVRIAVGRWALQGHEPLGWALGYLFGNLSQFRDIVRHLNLENWVCMPKLLESSSAWQLSDWKRPLQSFGAANVRLAVCVYCTSIIALGLNVVFRLTSLVEVDTRRKVFHGMMVVMFIPSIFLDPPFAALALALVLAIFLLLDLFRASQLPPLSRPLTHFLAPYVDGRDHRGPVIVSHIFLLIGCSIPLWLSLAAIDRTGQGPWEGWDIPTRDLSMVSGVICVGMGDAAASLIGRRFGRRRWCWSGGKSLEGSFAFAVAVILGLSVSKLGLRIGQWENGNTDSWALTMGKASLAAVGSSLTEAVLTGGNDNVIVPVILWLLVKGLKM